MEEVKDPEVEAMGTVSTVFADLQEEARRRVILWAADRYSITLNAAPSKRAASENGGGEVISNEDQSGDIDHDTARVWDDFAALYHASGAATQPQGMLVAAYWVGVIQKKKDFTSLNLNKLLKNLGHGASDVSKIMGKLCTAKPALILQVRKSGKTKQARKLYRLTQEGENTVERMINKND